MIIKDTTVPFKEPYSISVSKHSLRRHLLSGGGWALGGQIIATLTGLAVNVLLVRLLTPKEMGAYFLTL